MSLVTTSGGYMRELLAQSVETITASLCLLLKHTITHKPNHNQVHVYILSLTCCFLFFFVFLYF